jgi:hypothetical protein
MKVSLTKAETWLIGEVLIPMLEDTGEGISHWPFGDEEFSTVKEDLREKFEALLVSTFYNPNTCGDCTWGYGCNACNSCDKGGGKNE